MWKINRKKHAEKFIYMFIFKCSNSPKHPHYECIKNELHADISLKFQFKCYKWYYRFILSYMALYLSFLYACFFFHIILYSLWFGFFLSLTGCGCWVWFFGMRLFVTFLTGDLQIAAELKEKNKGKDKKEKKEKKEKKKKEKKEKKKEKSQENGDTGKNTLKKKLFKWKFQFLN